MASSRSTPRLRATVVLLVAVLAVVAVSERPLSRGFMGEALALAGLACIACAALGRIWTSLFIAGRKDAVLVREGPYAAVRHPLYALSMLAMLGAGLASGSAVITLALMAIFAAIYWLAARGEDSWLGDAHGSELERYRREVPAFLPRWSSLTVPETLEIRPRVLWKAFLDAGSLLGFYVLLRLTDALHASGLTPDLLTLP
jgi:protein-S-isoprenylcysteine O-methyltransferase Ste14